MVWCCIGIDIDIVWYFLYGIVWYCMVLYYMDIVLILYCMVLYGKFAETVDVLLVNGSYEYS